MYLDNISLLEAWKPKASCCSLHIQRPSNTFDFCSGVRVERRAEISRRAASLFTIVHIFIKKVGGGEGGARAEAVGGNNVYVCVCVCGRGGGAEGRRDMYTSHKGCTHVTTLCVDVHETAMKLRGSAHFPGVFKGKGERFKHMNDGQKAPLYPTILKLHDAPLSRSFWFVRGVNNSCTRTC